jgi:hypothetical protein
MVFKPRTISAGPHSLRWDLKDVSFGLTLRDGSVVRSGVRSYRATPNNVYVGILCCRISGGRNFM